MPADTTPQPPSAKMICRFAPSATGRAHPGTLLAGLLAWLDARSSSSEFILRIEDIDPQRVQPRFPALLTEDLDWLGLDWDQQVLQSSMAASHHILMDRLAQTGRLYACDCSRSRIRSAGLTAADGGYRYPGTCRHRTVTDWRTCNSAIRFNTEEIYISLKDLGRQDLSQDVSLTMGDPLLRRADGTFTYMLAAVADDHAMGIGRVVRGQDISPSTATQVALFEAAGWQPPQYRHHFLLLEDQHNKLAKFHKSISAEILKQVYDAPHLCGILASWAGLLTEAQPLHPRELLPLFSWDRIRRDDLLVQWDGHRLQAQV